MNNREPAFPVPYLIAKVDESKFECHYGMSLRDYFAGQIIGHLASNMQYAMNIKGDVVSTLCVNSYEIADTMLKVRGVNNA